MDNCEYFSIPFGQGIEMTVKLVALPDCSLALEITVNTSNLVYQETITQSSLSKDLKALSMTLKQMYQHIADNYQECLQLQPRVDQVDVYFHISRAKRERTIHIAMQPAQPSPLYIKRQQLKLAQQKMQDSLKEFFAIHEENERLKEAIQAEKEKIEKEKEEHDRFMKERWEELAEEEELRQEIEEDEKEIERLQAEIDKRKAFKYALTLKVQPRPAKAVLPKSIKRNVELEDRLQPSIVLPTKERSRSPANVMSILGSKTQISPLRPVHPSHAKPQEKPKQKTEDEAFLRPSVSNFGGNPERGPVKAEEDHEKMQIERKKSADPKARKLMLKDEESDSDQEPKIRLGQDSLVFKKSEEDESYLTEAGQPKMEQVAKGYLSYAKKQQIPESKPGISPDNSNKHLALWSKLGEKVSLSFTHCPNFSKYGYQKSKKGGSTLVRLSKDLNPSPLWHESKVKPNQFFSFVLNQLFHRDMTFGVIGEASKSACVGEVLKDRVCYMGCISMICNELKTRKVSPEPMEGDLVTVAVDHGLSMVCFYVNSSLMAGEPLPAALQSNCFFFVETATRHNKIRLL